MARSWYRAKWARISGAILLLGLTVALAAPFLIPVDRFRPLLVRLIEASTGRKVEIGALKLYVVPAVHIRAVNVRVKNPQGFPQGDALSVKYVDLGVAPRALLSRRLEVTYIALSGVRVNLLSDPAGRTNYESPAPLRSAPPGRAATAAGGASFLTLDRIGAVTVKDVEITVASFDPRRGQATPSLGLSGLNARIRSINLSTPDWPRRLDVAADLRGARLTAPVLARPVQFQTGELLVKGGAGRGTFAASLDDMRATGSVAIAGFDPLSITFAVAIPELDVDRLERIVTSSAGSGAAVQAPGPRRLLARGEVKIDRLGFSPLEVTQVNARLSVYTNTVHLDSYTLSAYGGTIQGAADLDYSAARLPAAVTATMRGVNLGRVVGAVAPQAQKVTGVLDADLRLATALGRDPKAALAGGGTFAARGLAVSPFEVSEANGRLSVSKSTIRLDSYALSAYGGTVQGAAALDYSAARLPAAVTARVRGVNLERVMSAMAPQARKITGVLEADIRLATALGRDPKAALTGGGTFAVRNGSFPGLDLKNHLAQMVKALQLNVPAGETRFSYFGGDLRIAQQRVHSNALRLDAEGLEGTGRGSFGFDKTLDYAGTGTLKTVASGTSLGAGALSQAGQELGKILPGAAGTTGVRVPFFLRGSFDDPKFSLAGTPQLIRGQPQQQPAQQQPQQPQLPFPQDLFKLFQ